MISTSSSYWYEPVLYQCHACGEHWETKVYTRLPACPNHPDIERPILMFPATLFAMKSWMRAAHQEMEFRERVDRLHNEQMNVALRCNKRLGLNDFCQQRFDVVYIADGYAYCRACAKIAGVPESDWIQLNG